MKRYRLTAEARRDLHRILTHIAEESPDAARRVGDLFGEKFTFLARNPGAGRAREDVRQDYRQLPRL